MKKFCHTWYLTPWWGLLLCLSHAEGRWPYINHVTPPRAMVWKKAWVISITGPKLWSLTAPAHQSFELWSQLRHCCSLLISIKEGMSGLLVTLKFKYRKLYIYIFLSLTYSLTDVTDLNQYLNFQSSLCSYFIVSGLSILSAVISVLW